MVSTMLRKNFMMLAATAAAAIFSLSAEPATAREQVRFQGETPGTIVVKTHERKLYIVLGAG